MKINPKRLMILLFVLSCIYAKPNVDSTVVTKSVENSFIRDSIYPFVYKKKAIAHYTRDITATEALTTAFLVQFVYAGGYTITQWDNIADNGSFENWYKNISKIHFDKDSYDYNIITHIGNAHYSYLFYRAMGYKKFNSFIMTAIGSTFFEFFIETITEPPSIQDLWQTPVLGSLLGLATESLSLFFINSDYMVGHIAAYILNPFLLFDQSHYRVVTVPVLDQNYRGVGVTISF